MHFTVLQSNGQPVLLAEGRIDASVLPRLRQALDAFQGDEIRLRSSGGNQEAAEEAGRMIRQQGLTTRIPAGSACFGACAFMFMGGQVRHVDRDGLVIVQMFTLTNDPRFRHLPARGAERDQMLDEVAVYSAQQATMDNDYVMRMGVARMLLSDIVYRQPAVATTRHPGTRRCLTEAELRHYNVVNDETALPRSAPASAQNPHK